VKNRKYTLNFTVEIVLAKMEKKMFGNKYDKKGMSLSIVLLVIVVILLIGVCLVYFVLYNISTANTIHIPDSIDSMYVRGNYMNYYINDIFEKSTKDFKPGDSKSKFIESFKNNLNNYKNTQGIYVVNDLFQIENQVNEANVNLDSKEINLNLNIVLFGTDENGVVVKYGYNYLISKNLETGIIKSDVNGNTGLLMKANTEPVVNNVNTVNTINTASDKPTEQNLPGVLEFQDGTSEANIYYNYTGKWYWSFQYNTRPKYIEWRSCELDPKGWGMNLKNQDFIKNLKGKNCDEGLKLLVTRTIDNNEGGHFSNTGLVFYLNGKSSQVDVNSGEIDCSNVMNHLKS